MHIRYSGELKCQDFLISVLKLSNFCQIDHSFQYALAELKQLFPFDVSLKLKLKLQFCIHEWIEPSFREIIECPVSSISCFEAHCMGMDNFWILTTMKAKVEEHYCTLTYTEPALAVSWVWNTTSMHSHVEDEMVEWHCLPLPPPWIPLLEPWRHPHTPARDQFQWWYLYQLQNWNSVETWEFHSTTVWRRYAGYCSCVSHGCSVGQICIVTFKPTGRSL